MKMKKIGPGVGGTRPKFVYVDPPLLYHDIYTFSMPNKYFCKNLNIIQEQSACKFQTVAQASFSQQVTRTHPPLVMLVKPSVTNYFYSCPNNTKPMFLQYIKYVRN